MSSNILSRSSVTYMRRSKKPLSFMASEKFEDSNALRIEELDLSQQIRYGKLDTRREISRFFRQYREGRGGSNGIGVEASRVLGQIARLNKVIKNVEKKLLSARATD